MRFVRFTTDAKTPTFISCHLDAFDYFGGYTKSILYDNTKNVVLKRALKSSDSQWNPLFRDFFTHYDFKPRLCKPGLEGAKTKGKVERVVQHVKKDFFLGLEFDPIPALNSLALTWCDDVNAKVHCERPEVSWLTVELDALEVYPIDLGLFSRYVYYGTVIWHSTFFEFLPTSSYRFTPA